MIREPCRGPITCWTPLILPYGSYGIKEPLLATEKEILNDYYAVSRLQQIVDLNEITNKGIHLKNTTTQG
jgi:hypothetical protein